MLYCISELTLFAFDRRILRFYSIHTSETRDIFVKLVKIWISLLYMNRDINNFFYYVHISIYVMYVWKEHINAVLKRGIKALYYKRVHRYNTIYIFGGIAHIQNFEVRPEAWGSNWSGSKNTRPPACSDQF